ARRSGVLSAATSSGAPATTPAGLPARRTHQLVSSYFFPTWPRGRDHGQARQQRGRRCRAVAEGRRNHLTADGSRQNSGQVQAAAGGEAGTAAVTGSTPRDATSCTEAKPSSPCGTTRPANLTPAGERAT